ncbi:glycosyltransferase family 4 protein [Caldiplasma sukawensis]
MKKKIDIILLPLLRNLDKNISSETYWALTFLKNLSKKYSTKAYVGDISPEGEAFLKSDINHIVSFRLGNDRTVKSDLNYYLLLCKYNLKNIRRVRIIHHFGGFGYMIGINPSFLMPKFRRKYIIGPILYPTHDEPDTAIKLGMLKKEHNYKNFSKKIFNLFNRLTFIRSDLVLFDCEETMEIYAEKYKFLKRKPSRIIPGGGIDRNEFFPKKITPPENRLTLGIASNLVKNKNVDKLILSLQFINKNVFLKIAGDGPEKDFLISLVQKLCLSSRVEFLGKLNHSELPDFYNHIDVYVALSDVPTLVKISVQEAMSCGCAIISGYSLIKENIKECEWGIIVNPNSLEAIKTAINQIYSDRNKLILMKENAAKFAQKNFSNEAIIGKISEVYDSYIVRNDEK